MKKQIALVLAVITLFTLSSCAEDDLPEDSLTYPTKITSVTEETSQTTTDTTNSEQTSGVTETTEQPIAERPDPIICNTWHQTKIFENGWRYFDIDLSECQYEPGISRESTAIVTPERIKKKIEEAAKSFGYKQDTYEYSYFESLIAISYYAAVADARIVSDPEYDNQFINVFLESYVDPQYFQEPYEALLYECFTLLKEADMKLYQTTIWDTSHYGGDGTYYSDYQYSILEKNTRIALLFSDTDSKLSEYAGILLKLSDVYPDYNGELLLSDSMKQTLQNIIKACSPVAENRERMMEKWTTYFHERKPHVEVQYELIPEVKAIKITLTAKDSGFLFEENFYPWVLNFNGTYYSSELGGYNHAAGTNSSPAVIYMPISYYYQSGGVMKLTICDAYKNKYDHEVKISINYDELSETQGDVVTIENDFLKAALEAEFGKDYTDIDLSKIKKLTIDFRTPSNSIQQNTYKEPYISFTFYDTQYGQGEGRSMYRYSDFYKTAYEGKCPKQIKEDIINFKCLTALSVYGGESAKSLFTDKELKLFLKEAFTALEASLLES